GTRIRGAPPVSSRVYLSAPAGTRDLITGGPDPDLLPLLPAWPARRAARMYAEAPVAPRLRRLAAGQLAADGIDTASLTVAGGAAEIAAVLRRYPATGVIEDDHAGPVAGVPGFTAAAGLGRWVTLRSVSKSLGPDLRLAVVAGDEATITRVAGRQALGTGWVSYQLQEMVAAPCSDAAAAPSLAEGSGGYAGRGGARGFALAARVVTAGGA